MSRHITQISQSKSDIQKEAGKTSDGKVIITDYKDKRTAFLLEDSRLKAVSIVPFDKTLLGSVHVAKIKNVASNLNACFVEIGKPGAHIVCFLPQKEARYPFLLNRKWDGRLLEGDEILVQVTKDAIKTKQPAVSANISLSNDYFAVGIGNTHTGYSGKLQPEQKEILKKAFKKVFKEISADPIPLPHEESDLPYGYIVRTKAGEWVPRLQAEEAVCVDELVGKFLVPLKQKFLQIFDKARHSKCYACIIPPEDPFENLFQSEILREEFQEIITDQADVYETLKELYPVRYYTEREQSELTLSKLFGLSSKMDAATQKKVWLKCGGYLVIEPTEALNVIDVNSGKFEGKVTEEELSLKINLEAAEEIAVQLRLRNLSGVIVVDFINMRSPKANKELMDKLTELVKRDRKPTSVVDMTKLGLVEITRKKTSKPLYEQI